MRNLIIVESPTKVKSIKKMIGKEDEAISTRGHIRDLRKFGKYWLGVDMEDNFKPIYTTMKGKGEVIKEIVAKSELADNILIATDPDREGEAIANNVKEVIDEKIKDREKHEIKRIKFNEITKKAVTEAIENPLDIDDNLVHSQQARRVVDRIIGFKLSALLKKKIKAKSAGRVQSVALKLIVDKEAERENFVSTKYFTIDVTLDNDAIISYFGDGSKESLLTDEKIKNELIKEIETKGLVLKKIEEKLQKQKAPMALKTSTLIQRASSLFGYSASSTMFIAQQLYEGIEIDKENVPLISYIRTDSTKIGDEAKNKILDHLKKGNFKYEDTKTSKKGKFEQGAHEAIRPINIDLPFSKLSSLTNQQLNVYKLIWYYSVTSFMEHSETKSTSYFFDALGHKFLFRKREIVKPGFKKLMNEFVDPSDKNNDTEFSFKEGDTYKSKDIQVENKETQPPKRFSISSLIKKLEELGIGRPSTYSSIIKTLKTRMYIEVEKKAFIPTKKGKEVVEALTKHFQQIISETYTASVEKDLDEIALGKATYKELVKRFYNNFEEIYKKAEVEMKEIPLEKAGSNCPDCGKDLVKRTGRFGEFVGCSGYPTCKYILKEKRETVEVGRNCPDCDKKLVERSSRRGKFIGCSGYPKCRYTEFSK